MAPKRPTHPKGTKELCDALSFIADTNIDIAIAEQAAGNDDKALEALEIATSATDDFKKWRCPGRAARVRKQIESLSAALKRSRKSGRSRAR